MTTGQGYASYLKDNDDVNPPVELSVPWDGMRHFATVGVSKGATFLANPVAVLNLVGLRAPEAKQVLKTVGFVRGQVSGTGDIVPNQSPVAGTQIPSRNAVNVTQPDPEDPGGSGDPSQQQDPSQPQESIQQQESIQPETSSQPGDGSGTSDGETPSRPETSGQLEYGNGGTSDGESRVTVPDLMRLSKEEAREALNARDLVLGEVSGEGDSVVGQSPIAGTMVWPESAVNVDMADYVVVPDLVGSTVPEAQELLAPTGLVLGDVSGEGEEVPAKCDVIESQDPAAEEEELRGYPVDVYLRSALVPVPNLVNGTVREARALLTASGLVLDNDAVGDSRVESQEPAAETLVCPGSAVTVTVSVPTVVEPGPTVVVPGPVVVVPGPPGGPGPPGVGPDPPGVGPDPPGVGPDPPVVGPDPPVVRPDPPVNPVAELIPRWWPIPATLIFLALLIAGLLASRAVRAQQGQKGAHTDIRVVAGSDFGSDVKVMESRADRSPPTCVVRIEPHADSGTQVVEEVYQ